MKLLVDANSDLPIYEQIKLQIKEQIVTGALTQGTMLPSIRMLARELQIGIITAKRVYDDLTAEGYTVAVAGKGVFVSDCDRGTLTTAATAELEKKLSSCIDFAYANGIDKEEFTRITEELWKKKI